ncbi:MAG: tetratricopeptide repeat protein [Planctomycetes bacterium]|nr:tetratricopeptide repeat protein [Planctomycetota bacterium]
MKRSMAVLAGCLLGWISSAAPASARPARAQDPAAQSSEDAALVTEALKEADKDRRRGEFRSAIRAAEETLADTPGDARALLLRARCHADQDEYEAALADGKLALEAARKAWPAVLPAALRSQAGLCLTLGRSVEAAGLLESEHLAPALDARDAWALARVAAANGKHDEARTYLEAGAATGSDQEWGGLLDKARCQRRLGDLSGASETLVAADEKTRAEGSSEADVLVELADLYFEADKEVAEGARRSAGQLYEEALRLHKTHEGATLGQYELYRFNWLRRRKNAALILDEYLLMRPESIPALVAGTSANLDDGNLKRVRSRLARLEKLAPQRRDVRALRAALAWIEHRTEDCRKELDALAKEDPADSMPARELAAHLCDLYRFGEAVPFAKEATERDPADYEAWGMLGKALANTGDEKGGLEALDKAQELAAPRQDAWRDNTRKVLKRMNKDLLRTDDGDLSFAWDPRAAEVFATYLMPFYGQARKELAARYGYTPGPTAIEVFGKHADFSVRSTGFEGYPALGVCFGPVVTAVSPLAEMRGTFSWARTSFHEFTHVIHLGLSHNRCPRWITEGIATWEEVNHNPSWSRNMRRDLVDALANEQLIPVRDLNAAFRTDRIIFAYYQGGLLCEMWVGSHGFPALVHLLEAFDKGLDLDEAFADVLKQTPEEVDRAFKQRVQEITADLKIEPRWDAGRVARLRLSLAPKPPADAAQLERWCEDWVTVAVGSFQSGARIDAEEALRHLGAEEVKHPRAAFLRGEIALAGKDTDEAVVQYQKAFAQGGDDFRARMALASLYRADDKLDLALAQARAAEKDFPGYPEKELNAERLVGAILTAKGDTDGAMQEIQKWLDCESGDFDGRMAVAAWLMTKAQPEQAARRLDEANQIDPFRRKLHEQWAEALVAQKKWADALREYHVGPIIPSEMDADKPAEMGDKEKAQWMAHEATCLRELGRNAEAQAKAEQALELDPACELANEELGKL